MRRHKWDENPFYQKLDKWWNQMNLQERKDKDGNPIKMNRKKFIKLAHFDTENTLAKQLPGYKWDDNGNKIPFPCISKNLFFQIYTLCHINPEDLLHDTEEEYYTAKGKGKETKEQLALDAEFKHLEEIAEKKKAKKPDRKKFENKKFTRDYWEKLKPFIPPPNPNIEVVTIPELSPKTSDGAELKAFYKRIAENYYKDAQLGIEVHETLIKGNNNEPGNFTTYKEAQKEITNAIDRALEANKNSSTFKYRRVFYLSPSECIHKRPHTQEDKIDRFLLETSIETIEHITNCFNNHEHLCEFYISPFHTFRSHALIDHTTFISEDYKRSIIDEQSFYLPYILYIDNVAQRSNLSELKNEFDKELGFSLGAKPKSSMVRLKKGDLKNHIETCLVNLQKKIDDSKQAISLLEKTINKSSELRKVLGFINTNSLEYLKKSEEKNLAILENQNNILGPKLKVFNPD